jgi:hypothetical protein
VSRDLYDQLIGQLDDAVSEVEVDVDVKGLRLTC